MNVTKALDDISYIKSLCKEARDNLYVSRPYFLLFAVLWMIGSLIPLIPGITTRFSLDGKHWPLLFLIGLVGTLILKRMKKAEQVPFMMRVLIGNWSLLFVFAVAVLFWSPGGYYSSVHMYDFWLMVVGVAYLMTGVTLQTKIGWVGVGFFAVSMLSMNFVLSIWYTIFSPAYGTSVEPIVFGTKAFFCGILLLVTWWLLNRQKAGARVE
ncbi:hypothetical protein [Caldalkalibacillus mannanilyticus]|uniref:hypothetical protein n=1 Tax=Caldalkalibacillus mannanilyticus TaxID=1418 RepID=UPI0004697364|nr:hypothetical protein [Caldalkalibacillus mannanilyticus]